MNRAQRRKMGISKSDSQTLNRISQSINKKLKDRLAELKLNRASINYINVGELHNNCNMYTIDQVRVDSKDNSYLCFVVYFGTEINEQIVTACFDGITNEPIWGYSKAEHIYLDKNGIFINKLELTPVQVNNKEDNQSDSSGTE